MTFKVTVVKLGGEPIAMALVTCNDETTGMTFSRGTDGSGYADVDMKATPTDGRPITLSVVAGGYKNAIQYPNTSPHDQEIQIVLASFRQPFQPAPRYWTGVNMCGVRVPNLPPIAGGANDPTLFLSWFYPFYPADWRLQLRDIQHAAGKRQWLMSWPDARARGFSPSDFLASCDELTREGFSPCVMLTSKDFDRDPNNHGYLTDENADQIIADLLPVLPTFVGSIPLFCEGWELGDWMQPWQVQWLIDAVAPVVLAQAGTLNYVHLGQGKGSWQEDGKPFAAFWNANIGKLHGLLHEKVGAHDKNQYRYDSGGLYDILIRFAGGAGCSPDDGTGHAFDLVALEITAQNQFDGSMSEAEGDTWAVWARDTPAVTGPHGWVGVSGSAN